MNAYARRVTRIANRPASLGPSAKHHLTSLDTSKVAQRLVVFTPTAADIDYLLPQARRQMGGGAATEVVHRMRLVMNRSVTPVDHQGGSSSPDWEQIHTFLETARRGSLRSAAET